jgi:putative two-component system response regulator
MILTRMLEQGQVEASGHLLRMQRYVRTLAEATAASCPGGMGMSPSLIRALEISVPLHDLGKLALPEHIRLKTGNFSPEERMLMEEHTTLGAEMLHDAARQYGNELAFLPIALEVIRSHHERWDGTGYPNGLAGKAIPLSARITAIADTYDALRSRARNKLPLPHPAAVNLIVNESKGQFDPELLSVFASCAAEWEGIHREVPDHLG